MCRTSAALFPKTSPLQKMFALWNTHRREGGVAAEDSPSAVMPPQRYSTLQQSLTGLLLLELLWVSSSSESKRPLRNLSEDCCSLSRLLYLCQFFIYITRTVLFWLYKPSYQTVLCYTLIALCWNRIITKLWSVLNTKLNSSLVHTHKHARTNTHRDAILAMCLESLLIIKVA